MEFDHELRLWLKSKNSRKTHLDTRVEGGTALAAQSVVSGPRFSAAEEWRKPETGWDWDYAER